MKDWTNAATTINRVAHAIRQDKAYSHLQTDPGGLKDVYEMSGAKVDLSDHKPTSANIKVILPNEQGRTGGTVGRITGLDPSSTSVSLPLRTRKFVLETYQQLDGQSTATRASLDHTPGLSALNPILDVVGAEGLYQINLATGRVSKPDGKTDTLSRAQMRKLGISKAAKILLPKPNKSHYGQRKRGPKRYSGLTRR